MLHKRLDYGYNGFQVPFIPRAARSSRRRGPVQKKVEDDQLYAFDLLAAVAGKILLEGVNPDMLSSECDLSNVPDLVKEDIDKGILSPVVEHCDQRSADVGSPSLALKIGIPGLDHGHSVKEVLAPPFDTPSVPVATASGCLEKLGSFAEIDLNDDRIAFFDHSGEPEGLGGGCVDSCVPSAFASAERHDDEGVTFFGTGPDPHCSEDPEILDGKPPELVSSDSSVKLSLGNDHHQCSSQSPCGDNNVQLVSRDDDENSSECTQPSTMKTTRLPARIGDRRIRKLLASKYWRVVSKSRDGDLSDTVRCLHRSRRIGFKGQRSQRIYPFKKRRFFHYNSISSSHADIRYKGVYSCADKAVDMSAFGFGSMGQVNGSSPCVAGQSTAFSSRESNVKVRIKSFRVPELFIEIPETSTVGSLKRTVLEAVTALLGGRLRVEVLLQGKKIRDDNRTLLQSGICHSNKAESLGFSLEPNPFQVGAPVCSEDNSHVLSADVPQPVSRCPITPAIHQGISHPSAGHLVSNLGAFIDSDHDSAPSPVDLSAEKGTCDSRALVALPISTPQPLAVVAPHKKSKRSDMGQRRIRRPFSVGEVEALVQAVEKLGTGRWRDVKLGAFDNVKHRTYVDLKDKWKTLVHTARISPQQRRGEPVPQELLDRVLAAHAYWSQQQAKQQPSDTRTCLVETS